MNADRPTSHRLGARPDVERHVLLYAGVQVRRPHPDVAATRLHLPAPSLLARLLGGPR